MRPNEISYKVIGAAMKVHTAKGPSLVESAYEKCLCRAFSNAGLQFRRQVALPVEYEGVQISPAYKVDFIVENCVVVEIKCVEKVLAVHEAQLLSYLKLTNLAIGLLLNFKVAHMRDGITRRINAPEADL
jgi:GxxExxY protein